MGDWPIQSESKQLQTSRVTDIAVQYFSHDSESVNGYEMLVNDTMQVQLFNHAIPYGDTSSVPIAVATVVFPGTDPTQPLNIAKWVQTVALTFAHTSITIGTSTMPLSSLLSLDWTFYPYRVNYVYQKSEYLKSVLMKLSNQSSYYIRLLGPWNLLQFFGKPMGTKMVMPMPMGAMSSSSMCACNG